MNRRYLVTGANGCIGAWIVKILLERDDEVTTLDLDTGCHRLDSLFELDRLPEIHSRIYERSGDVAEPADVRSAVEAARPDAIIHLAGLQVPTCRANPILGARVNVGGTLNIFEAAREAGTANVTYASSAAVYGPAPADRAIKENEFVDPRTHYGVFKLANEGNADIYWNDHQVPSAGLRPLTIYGPGRDQGMTSAPTTAMKSAVLGAEFTMPLTGSTDFLYVEDAARAFIACADAINEGAHVFNISGESTTFESCKDLIEDELPEDRRGLVACDGGSIPIAPNLDDDALRASTGYDQSTSLGDGVRKTMEAFQRLEREGRLDRRDLPDFAGETGQG
jgi:nucleoside-diphosphate-sugar epimerase